MKKQITPHSHTIDETMHYAMEKYDYVEVGQDDIHYQLQYEQTKQDLLHASGQQSSDIGFHMLRRRKDDIEMILVFLESDDCIAGSASSDKPFQTDEALQIYCDVMDYFGVTQADIDQKTQRYQRFVQTLHFSKQI